VVSHLPQSWVNYLGSHDSDWIGNYSNFFAGWGDTLSFGVTSYIRQWGGWDAVNYNSGAYFYGQVTGTGQGLLMMVAGGGVNAISQTGVKGNLGLGVRRLFWDNRRWNTVRNMWSKARGGLEHRELALHHVIIPQRWGWPQGITNAGWNYMAMSSWRNSVLLTKYPRLGYPFEWAYRIGYMSQFNPIVNLLCGRYPGCYYVSYPFGEQV